MAKKVTHLPAPATEEEANAIVAKLLAIPDSRLKVVVLMEGGGRVVVFLPEQERLAFEAAEPRAKDTDVIIIKEEQAKKFGVL